MDTVRSPGIQLLADKLIELQLFTKGDVIDRNTKRWAKYVLAYPILARIEGECDMEKVHVTLADSE